MPTEQRVTYCQLRKGDTTEALWGFPTKMPIGTDPAESEV